MHKFLLIFIYTTLFVAADTFAQNTFIPIGADEERLVDRLETFGGFVSKDFNSALKPFSRRDVVDISNEYLEYYQVNINEPYNELDVYNAKRAIDISGEWGKPNHQYPDASTRRDKMTLKYFFDVEPNFLMHSDEDFYFALNPVLYVQSGIENNHSDLKYIFMRGAEARAKLFNRIGIYTFLAETQEKFPSYMTAKGLDWKAFPGFDFYSGGPNKKPFDGFMTRAYIDVPFYKDRINATFGYDKNFIGDGMRSLFLSNSGAPYTFLRLRYAFGNVTYQNLFMELMDDFYAAPGSRIPKKYASMHYLGLNLGRKVNIGFFESTIFNTPNQINAMGLLPIIYANTLNNRLGDNPDGHQSNVGMSFKYMPVRYIQIYGQGLVQDIDWDNLKNGSWKNQFATQLGLKYFNVFEAKDMDLLLEWNTVRPFMYGTEKQLTHYTHYNQPLAHPQENGFQEFIAAIYFQPSTKVNLEVKAIYTLQNTKDSLVNNGIGIFESNDTRVSNNGFNYFDNNIDKSVYFNFHGSYEAFRNFYIDFGLTQMTTARYKLQSNSFMFYAGLRWNMQRREYDFN